jgi:hypothetical protein
MGNDYPFGIPVIKLLFAIIVRLLSLFIVSTMYICIFQNNIVDISDATDKKKNKKDCLDGDIKMASLVLILIRS